MYIDCIVFMQKIEVMRKSNHGKNIHQRKHRTY